jgi:predicted phosphohydrolase
MSLRLAWLTDIHLNFLEPEQLEGFCAELRDSEADAFLISGDISEAPTLQFHLDAVAQAVERPVYFVLGNHDFYRGSVREVRSALAERLGESGWLRYLSQADSVSLTENWALVGHDGWADGRFGDYFGSPVMLNDYVLIEELAWLSQEERLGRIQTLAEEAAAHLKRCVPAALADHDHVLVATHVPPFREACWYEGQISNDDYLPHFSSKASGDALMEALAARPEKEGLVLCGHTHGAGWAQPLPNLQVRTGGAEYRHPKVQEILVID